MKSDVFQIACYGRFKETCCLFSEEDPRKLGTELLQKSLTVANAGGLTERSAVTYLKGYMTSHNHLYFYRQIAYLQLRNTPKSHVDGVESYYFFWLFHFFGLWEF